jgi:hypothetical protein
MLFFAGGPQLGEIEAGVAARLMGGPLSVAVGGLACVAMVGVLAAITPQLRTYDGAYGNEPSPILKVAPDRPDNQDSPATSLMKEVPED